MSPTIASAPCPRRVSPADGRAAASRLIAARRRRHLRIRRTVAAALVITFIACFAVIYIRVAQVRPAITASAVHRRAAVSTTRARARTVATTTTTSASVATTTTPSVAASPAPVTSRQS